MTSPNPRFTENPARAVYVQGYIDQALVYRLTPEIITLLNQSREPITVYIDSPGGLVTYMQALLKLLKSSDQSFSKSCRIITVVTSRAASAAADMLAAGDYALAYPESTIIYHGVRIPGDRPLTAEETSLMAQRLRAGNDSFAMELAREAEFRFIFRFISLKDEFPTVRQGDPDMSDLDCLLALISEKLTESANDVLKKARDRYRRYHDLLLTIFRKSSRAKGYRTRAEQEAAQIKAIVDFERKGKDKDWGFFTDGIHQLTDDFFLLHEYLWMIRSERFKQLCLEWADFLLTDEELEEINQISDEKEKSEKTIEKARPHLRPIWSFFVALCHVLQEGENELTATDAFWLGLIDEVIGVRELPSFRLFAEFSEQQRAKDEKDKIEEGDAQPATALALPPADTNSSDQ